jgi:hypothetical protein
MTTVMLVTPRSIRNATAFGSRLRAASKAILPRFLKDHDHGFQDGGCAIMAEAIVEWSEGRLRHARYVLADQPHRVQHVVAWDGALVLDGDGAMTPDEGVEKLRFHEMRPGCMLLDGYDPTSSQKVPWDERASRWIADELRARLPDPKARPWSLIPQR